MTNKLQILLQGACVLLFFISAQSQPLKNRDEARLLKTTLLKFHVSPPTIDDHFSAWIYDSFLDELDPERLYFTEPDLRSLEVYRNKLDDELNGTSWAFLPAVTQVYKKSLMRAEHLSAQLFQSPIWLESTRTYFADTTWAADEKDLQKRWLVAVTYNLLSRLHEIRGDADADDNKFLKETEPRARGLEKASMMRSISRITNHAAGYENYIASLYLQTIATAFDPHSAYLSATAMENFLSSLSSEGYYFGLMLDENEKGEITIEHLTPGGPAWKSGRLNSGDIIRQVKWEGREAMDVTGLGVDEMNALLLEDNHAAMEITVAKPGGLREVVVLRKEKMQSEENIVKSFILQGKRKIGYISLPGFYTNWGEAEGSRCANDVAKEIIKLKKEGIEGLILDLRFNGGGSLQEAVSMAGIFIDAGPVGVVKGKAGEATTMKDMNRGTVYDGPLEIMVNGMSASASEFLAAALQDYQRAIIVGSKTYGKASAQTLLPLHAQNSGASVKADLKPGSYASVTFEKIYRITGKTAQASGVVPHIQLPDLYDSLLFREDLLPRALPHDSIFKKTYYQPLMLLPVSELRHKSEQRTKMNAEFFAIKEASGVLGRSQMDTVPVSLRWSDFSKRADEQAAILKKIEKSGVIGSFTIGHHQFEMQRMQMDQFVDNFNKSWIKKLEKDILLEEAFLIICDLIDIHQRKPK
jgi:carboxyl-terminal processing protease